MKLKRIVDEDFVNYKLPSMFIAFPNCTFKCERECHENVCQNKELHSSPTIEMDISDIVHRYTLNDITSAIVMGGMEPFDSYDELVKLIATFRLNTKDDIVIYTGYYPNEIAQELNEIAHRFTNIIVKFGRYKPHEQMIFSEVLGVNLASDNQYAEKIS